MAGEPDREVRASRYRRSLCIDCGNRRYSPGRPRCDECHDKLRLGDYQPGLKRQEAPRRTVRVRRRRHDT